MDPKECLAGMDGAAVSAIESPKELEALGMSSEDADFYFTMFQIFKKTGVPTKLLKKPTSDSSSENK